MPWLDVGLSSGRPCLLPMSESEGEPVESSKSPLEPSNGLGLADTLAQNHNPAYEAVFSSEEDPDEASEDELPATDREGLAINQNDLFAQVYEMNRVSRLTSMMRAGPEPDAGAATGAGAPKLLNISISESPLASPVHTQSPHSPEQAPESVFSTPDPDVIDETPSEHPTAKIVDIWCKTLDLKWRPGYMLEELQNGMILVRIAGDEEPVTVNKSDTKPIILEVGKKLSVFGQEGKFRVTGVIKDPLASFATPDKVARLELFDKGRNYVAGLDQIYWQQQQPEQPPSKRPKLPRKPQSPLQVSTAPSPPETPSKLFNGCVFLLSGIARQDEDQLRIQKLIQNYGGLVEQTALHLVNHDTLEWNNTTIQFGAVLTSTSTFTTKAVEAQVIGWPILSFTFVTACIAAGELVEIEQYLLKRPFKQCPSLSEQFMTRRLPLGSVVPPVYLLTNGEESKIFEQIMAICFNKKIKVARSEEEVPEGSLVVSDQSGEKTMHMSVARALSRQLKLQKTVVMNKTWLLQSIIDGRAA